MIDLYKVYSPSTPFANKIEEIIHSGKLTSGFYLNQFEKKIRDFIGNPYILVVSNYNYASLISLALCDLRNNDEVIASPMSCLASNQPVLNFGAKIVWADIDPNTGSLNPEDVIKKISRKTKAIIHYHWAGYPGYIDEINQIGIEYGIPVIDDAIESFGSRYKGFNIGNLGSRFTLFSFQTVRLPNSIDGGAIAFSNEADYHRALKMRDFGIDRKTFRNEINEISSFSDIDSMGYNAIMNEVNAFIGQLIMEDVPELLEKQKQNALMWDEVCHNEGYQPLSLKSGNEPNYWVYSFLTDRVKEDLVKYRSEGYYASQVHLRNDYYSCFGKFDSSLKGVRTFEEKQLSVPSGWWFEFK
jgi:perosamine synthetase